METDPSQTVRGMAEEPSVPMRFLSFDDFDGIGKVKKLEKWVPHDLNNRQKLSRFEVCFSLLQRNQNDLFWWVFAFGKCSSEWLIGVQPLS